MSDNENEYEVIASAGSKGNMLMFSLGEYQGIRTFDVRKHFYSARENEYKPTRKGITFSRRTFEVFLKVLGEKAEDIRDWLESEDTVTQARSMRAKKIDSQQRSVYRSRPHETAMKEWSSPEPFVLRAEGAKDVLVINESHSIATQMSSQPDNNSLVEHIMISMGRARDLVDNETDETVHAAIDTFFMNFGILLDQQLAGRTTE